MFIRVDKPNALRYLRHIRAKCHRFYAYIIVIGILWSQRDSVCFVDWGISVPMMISTGAFWSGQCAERRAIGGADGSK
jgi:hypothetical protein